MGLPEDLAGVIPEKERTSVPRRYDVIGDIAILSLPGELHEYRFEIAETITGKRKHINTVLDKVSMVDGEKRLATFELLSGSSTITTHREYGVLYRLDVTRVFFNPCLASERQRVTSQVCPGESVVVPFAGVGPFVIPVAKKGSFVVAIENNPDALHWLSQNINLNKVRDRVMVINGDARDPSAYHEGEFDRAIIPAPYGTDTMTEEISPIIRKGGMIHFYTFGKDAEIPCFISSFREKGLETVRFRKCGNVAPGVRRFVFDLVKTYSDRPVR
jgi:tRNA (guanine37-N1)-methyltransferase